MKNRLLIALTATTLMLGLISADVMAEPGRHGPESHGADWHQGPPSPAEQLARMEQALDLSDEQSAAMLTVLQNAGAEREALHQRMREQFQPDICGLQQQTEADILAILTADQADEFARIREERDERRDQRKGVGGPELDCGNG